LKAFLIRLAVWGSQQDWEKVFGEEEGSTDELLSELKHLEVLSYGGQGKPYSGNPSGTGNS